MGPNTWGGLRFPASLKEIEKRMPPNARFGFGKGYLAASRTDLPLACEERMK
jgi:hypothetical protein